MQKNRRILLTCFGTLGEVIPVLKLARELGRHGNTVHVCGPDYGRQFFAPVCASYSIMPTGRALSAPTADELKAIFRRASEYLTEDADRLAGAAVAQLHAVILRERIEEVIYSWITPAGALAAHQAGISATRLYLYPLALNQQADPPVIPRWPRATAAHRDLATRQRLRHVIARRFRARTPQMQEIGARLGLPPEAYEMMPDGPSAIPGIALFDQRLLLVPEPGVSFLTLPDERRQQAPMPELTAFLEAGAPPVILSLGSMMWPNKEVAIARLVRAARALSVPLILIMGQPGPRRAMRRDGMLILTEYPLAAAAPLGRLVIHHGGIGSLQETLAAGRPALTVPLQYDQFDNARRLAALGLGATADMARLDDRALTDLLARTLEDEEIGARCRAWAAAA